MDFNRNKGRICIAIANSFRRSYLQRETKYQRRIAVMAPNFAEEIVKIAEIDLFKRDDKTGAFETGIFIGRPFHIDYDRAHILVADSWKEKAKGVPQGSFLLAYYENEEEVLEALLLRVLKPSKLPTDNDVVSSMIEYFKDNLKTSGKESQLDSFTRYEFSFSGLECRILGTFYKDTEGKRHFGADVENFYSAHNYSVIKPNIEVLKLIVNLREEGITDKPTDIPIGTVRYSSSRRFQRLEKHVTVFVSPADFLGKRTALFGMTRTGKSNTVKKIIQATVLMSKKATKSLDAPLRDGIDENLDPFTDDGTPKYPVGQIIFDMNGEYANPNLQDEGTAIFELYKKDTTRYSTIKKDGFKVMKVNFYRDIIPGFKKICDHLSRDQADYVKSFLSIDLTEPSDKSDKSAMTRFGRKRAAYLCCLYKADFEVPDGYEMVKFEGNKELNEMVWSEGGLDPSKGIALQDACDWFTTIWDNQSSEFFENNKSKKGHPWVDEDLAALLIFLTRKSKPGGKGTNSGYIKLRDIAKLHTETVDKPFEEEVVCRNCCNFVDALYPTTITPRPSINTYYPLSTPH
jgi:hypothetical protein